MRETKLSNEKIANFFNAYFPIHVGLSYPKTNQKPKT